MRSILPLCAVLLATASGLFAQSPLTSQVDVGTTTSRNTVPGTSVVHVPGTSRFLIAWSDEEGVTSNLADVYVAISRDEGVSFGAPVRIDTGDLPFENNSQNVRITALDNGTVVVIWEDLRPPVIGGTGEQLWYNFSRDAGRTWQPAAQQLTNTTDIDSPQLVSVGNTAYVIGENEDGLNGEGISFATFDGIAGTWSPVIDVHNTFSAGAGNDVDDPFISATATSIVIAFNDNRMGTEEAFALTSFDSGMSWTENSLETFFGEDTDNVMVAADGPIVIVAWVDQLIGNNSNDNTINAAISTDGGLSFGTEFALTDTVTAANMSGAGSADVSWFDLAVRGTDIYAVYAHDVVDIVAGGTGGQAFGDVYFAVSRDFGTTWATDLPLGNLPGPANRPTLALGAEQDLYVWFETGPNGANGGAFAWSRDAGTSFNAVEAVISAGTDVDASGADHYLQHEPIAVDPVSGRCVATYFYNPLGANDVYASSLRAPFLNVTGTVAIGDFISFEVTEAKFDSTSFLVGISELGAGPTDLGPGLPLLHLNLSPLSLFALEPTNGLLPFFSGAVTSGTGSPLIPIQLPFTLSGQTFTFTAALLDGFGALNEVTDPVTITIP